MSNKQPAAWGMEHPDGDIIDVITPEEHAREEGGYTVALYREREWVGLTDEVIEQGCKESWVTKQAWESAVWWAEAKLKELNT